MKKYMKKLICMILAAVIFSTCLMNSSETILAAKTKNGIDYQSGYDLKIGTKGILSFSGYNLGSTILFRIEKVTSNNKNLKVKFYKSKSYTDSDSFYIFSEKKGNYSVSVTLKAEKSGKKEIVKIPVTVRDINYNPIKKMTIDGKEMDFIEGGENSYFSPKRSGKLNISPSSDYKITKIEVEGPDTERRQDTWLDEIDPYYYYGGKYQIIKNNQKVSFNYKAKGKTSKTANRPESKVVTDDYRTPYDFILEDYDFLMAVTKVTVYYSKKHSYEWEKNEFSTTIKVYTEAK